MRLEYTGHKARDALLSLRPKMASRLLIRVPHAVVSKYLSAVSKNQERALRYAITKCFDRRGFDVPAQGAFVDVRLKKHPDRTPEKVEEVCSDLDLVSQLISLVICV